MLKSYFVMLFMFIIPFLNPLSASDQLITNSQISLEQIERKSFKQNTIAKLKNEFTEKDGPTERKNNRNGWLSLVLVVLAWVMIIFQVNILMLSAFLFSILGIVFGFRGLKRDKNRGMAIIGLLLGLLPISGILLVLILMAIFGLNFG